MAKPRSTTRPSPYTVYTGPQSGRVGVTEKQARYQGLDYRVAKMSMHAVARAFEIDRPRDFMKALVDPTTRQVLGAAILAVEGGEIMAIHAEGEENPWQQPAS